MGLKSEEVYAILKGTAKSRFLGSVNSLTTGNEQTELTAFAGTPQNGDQIAVISDDTVWMYSEAASKWVLYRKNQPIANATKSSTGVVRIGDGINVLAGEISTSKELIGLDNVDNIKQYSENNPVPITVKFDNINYKGKSNQAVDIKSNAVKFIPQPLNASQKEQARQNIGAIGEIKQSNYTQTDTTAQDYIKNKPFIPTKQSEVINDDYTVKDQKYDSRVFANESEKTRVLNQVEVNRQDIVQIKKYDARITKNTEDIVKEQNRATVQENQLQLQINKLKGKTQIIGGTNCAIGQEQTTLTTYTKTKTGQPDRPRSGDTVNIIYDDAGNVRQEQWTFVEITDNDGTVLRSYWEMTSGPPLVTTATETDLGVVKVPENGGLMIDVDGNVTATKTSIGLQNVDNVRQYSEQNPAPDKITIDGVLFNGNSKDGVSIKTNAVLYDRNQVLTEAQLKTARSNLKIKDVVKPDWNLPENQEGGILNKPEIPKKLSQLINDADYVSDANYVHTDNNFTTAVKDNISDNTTNIQLLKDRVTNDETDIQTERLNRQNADSDLQNQIDSLKGTPTFVGSIQTMTAKTDLTDCVQNKTGKTPVKGQMVSVLDANIIYMFNGTDWEVYLKTTIADATLTQKGVVQIGTGIAVNNGVISTDKTLIGLNNVENVKQYSLTNPVPMKITLDGTTTEGNSATGVNISTDYVKYGSTQNLTNSQKQVARANIGINDDFLVKSDWDAATGDAGEILNKPVIPDKYSQLANDNDTVIDANYDGRVFATKTEKDNTFDRITTNEEDIQDIKDEQIIQNTEIEKLKKKSFWVGSIQKFTEDDPTPEQKNADLNKFVLEKTGGTPGEGYQVSVLSHSSVYQYSATTKTWDVFVENQVIQYASDKDAGVIKVGKGLKIDPLTGILDSEAAGGDWNIGLSNKPGYIKNRTHFETGTDGWITFDLDNWKERGVGEYNWTGTDNYSVYVRVIDEPLTMEELRAVEKYKSISVDNDGNLVESQSDWPKDDGQFSDFPSSGRTNLPNYSVFNVYDETKAGLKKGFYVTAYFHKTTNDYRISISAIKLKNFVKKLDPKYIPDEFATKEWVLDQESISPNSDWNVTNVNNLAYIKNKPYGTLPIIDVYFDFDDLNREDNKKCHYGNYDFVWVGDSFQSNDALKKNQNNISVVLKDDNGDDKILSLEYVMTYGNKDIHLYHSSNGMYYYETLLVDKDITDAAGNVTLCRGIYLRAVKYGYQYISHIYSDITYEKHIEIPESERVILENPDWLETDPFEKSYIRNKPYGTVPIFDAYNPKKTPTDTKHIYSTGAANYYWSGETAPLSIIENYLNDIDGTYTTQDGTTYSINTGDVEVTKSIISGVRCFTLKPNLDDSVRKYGEMLIFDDDVKDANGNILTLKGVYARYPKDISNGILHLFCRTATYEKKQSSDDMGVDVVHSNWSSTNPTSSDYIKNKPFGIVPLLDIYYAGDTKQKPYSLIDDGKQLYYASDIPIDYDTFLNMFKIQECHYITEDNIDIKLTYSNVVDLKAPVEGKRYDVIDNKGGVYSFALVTKDVYEQDAPTSLLYKKGVYVTGPSADGNYLSHIYTDTVFDNSIKTINGISLFQPGDIKTKTINGDSIIGTGDIKTNKMFTTMYDGNTERNVSINYGIPKYKSSISDEKFKTNALSISQGIAESSGISFDGDGIVLWSPCDRNAIEYFDEDGAEDMVFKINADGKGWGKTATSSGDDANTWTTKGYVDNSAVPNTTGAVTQYWTSGSTYTAPNNGWVYLYKSGSMSSAQNSQGYFYVRVGSSPYRYHYAWGNKDVTACTVMCPVSKGETLYFYFNVSPTTKYFIPTKAGY